MNKNLKKKRNEKKTIKRIILNLNSADKRKQLNYKL